MKAGVATDQWKRTLDDYVNAAQAMFCDMAINGFRAECSIPVDSDHELLDGSHRLACALALNIEAVPVIEYQRRAWAPPWDYDWFVAKGMSQSDLSRLTSDWMKMQHDTFDD